MEEKLDVDNEQISVLTYCSDGNQTWCLSLHGGGPSTKETTEYLSTVFLDRQISFCSFDFFGQGTSSGDLAESSLKSRVNQTAKVISHISAIPLVLVGTSMGGYIALKLAATIGIKNLILFCPAAYSTSAWDLRFGHGFTEEIRRERSYLESDAEELCRKIAGNVLVVYGSDDKVIPTEVQSMYETSFQNATYFKSITIPNCPHPIHRWIQDRTDIRISLIQEIQSFVENTDRRQ